MENLPAGRGAMIPGYRLDSENAVCRSEDRLTASFFGIARNLSSSVWACILPKALLGETSVPPKVHLWRRYRFHELDDQYNNTEPDVTLEFEARTLFVEVKDESGFGSSVGEKDNQLRREWVLGKRVVKDATKQFHLITLTRMAENRQEEVRRTLGDYYVAEQVHCIYWEDIYQSLAALQEFADSTEQRFVGELLELLKERGFDAPPRTPGQREFDHYLGEGHAEKYLSALSDALGEDVRGVAQRQLCIPRLAPDVRNRLLAALNILFDVADRPIPNGADLQLQNILPNFLLVSSDEPDAYAVSNFFYEILSRAYYEPNLRLFGKNNFSIGIRTPKGDISVLTGQSSDLSIVIRLIR